MDAVNLNPTPPSGATSITSGVRARPLQAALDPKVAAAAAASESATARPASGLTAVGDRVERSPALQEQIARLKQALATLPPRTPEQSAEVERRTDEALHASSATRMRAAASILDGELHIALQ